VDGPRGYAASRKGNSRLIIAIGGPGDDGNEPIRWTMARDATLMPSGATLIRIDRLARIAQNLRACAGTKTLLRLASVAARCCPEAARTRRRHS
jgi:hypothetical protein